MRMKKQIHASSPCPHPTESSLTRRPAAFLAAAILVFAFSAAPLASHAVERISDPPRAKRISDLPVDGRNAPPAVVFAPEVPPPAESVPLPSLPAPASGDVSTYVDVAESSVPEVTTGSIPLPADDGAAKGPRNVPLRDQLDPGNGGLGPNACGPTCLAMALEYFGKKVTTANLIAQTHTSAENGATVKSLIDVANRYLPSSHFSWGIAFGTDPIEYLKKYVARGSLVIVPISGKYGDGKEASPDGHFILVTDVSGDKVYVNDPAGGERIVLTVKQLEARWRMTEEGKKPCAVIRR